jgi:subtilisin family serine protease
MKTRNMLTSVLILVALLSCPAFVSARTYSVPAAGERLEFVPQPEKGYVVKLPEKAGGIRALAGISALEAEGARKVRGLGRRGVWTVENEGPASRNEDTIRSLRASGQLAYAAPLFSSNGETVAILPEIVIRVEPDMKGGQLQGLCEKAGCTIKKRMEFTTQEYLLEVLGPDADAVFAAVEQLSQVPEVEWACPNTASQPRLCGGSAKSDYAAGGSLRIASAGQDANNPGVFPNDEYFPRQWYLHNTGQSGGTPGVDIRAPEAWEITTGDSNIVIAVTGTGVDTHHPDLVNNLVPGYDFLDDDNTPDPANEGQLNAHDTLCAGLVAAQGNNGIGVAGVAYHCKIMPIRTYSPPTASVTQAEEATSFRWAATHGADVLSNSWVETTSPAPILYSAIVDITKAGAIGRRGKGCVVVFCAGNDDRPIPYYPQKYPEVVVVGATDDNDVRWNYSNYGPALDIVAPSGCDDTSCGKTVTFWSTDQTGPNGWSILNSDPNILDYAEYFGGTSASCPIAAGVAALILSVEPNLTGDEVRHFLERSAKDLGDPGRDDYYGWGRVDARAALDMVLAKRADLNNDWKVDEEDRAILMRAMETDDRSADIAPAAKRDGVVDAKDLELLTRYLGTVIPEVGLIAHWKLDETEGTVAHNAAGDPGYNATLYGDPSWQPAGGKIGGALAFDGVDDCVRSPFVVDPWAGPFSVFAWAKGGGPGQVILSQEKGADWLMVAADGALKTGLKGVGRLDQALASPAVIVDDAWHRVGLVWDGSNRILYVDDIKVVKDTQATKLPSSPGGLYIGAGSKLATDAFWSGLIDDVRIYNRAVTP